MELSPHNINVNAIAPGIIATKMTEDMLKDKKTKKDLLANTPLGRVGQPEEIGKAAVFLASDDSNFITGHTLVVDGGWLTH
jgi:NAD(P)-dependent dehydrogenase (short-subunit alcohol dehydrogenase family)